MIDGILGLIIVRFFIEKTLKQDPLSIELKNNSSGNIIEVDVEKGSHGHYCDVAHYNSVVRLGRLPAL